MVNIECVKVKAEPLIPTPQLRSRVNINLVEIM